MYTMRVHQMASQSQRALLECPVEEREPGQLGRSVPRANVRRARRPPGREGNLCRRSRGALRGTRMIVILGHSAPPTAVTGPGSPIMSVDLAGRLDLGRAGRQRRLSTSSGPWSNGFVTDLVHATTVTLGSPSPDVSAP